MNISHLQLKPRQWHSFFECNEIAGALFHRQFQYILTDRATVIGEQNGITNNIQSKHRE
jgi:hypothetical protein